MMNEKEFENPHIFKPERFLDSKGKFKPHPHIIYFGVGKRR